MWSSTVRNTRSRWLSLVPLLILLCPTAWGAGTIWADSDASLVVHEWGTFTELQDEEGRSLPGINTDDEPVPGFVHGFGRHVLSPTVGPWRMKGLPFRHPQMTMRLETPVIYFYARRETNLPLKVDLTVRFQDGWLSEFYPQAEFTVPGWEEWNLTPGTTSTLTWTDLQVGTRGSGPETDEPVWQVPRQTDSLSVTTSGGESEKYLFYRGVGNFEGPLRVTTDRKAETLTLHDQLNAELDPAGAVRLAGAWLVSSQPEGLAFHSLGPLSRSSAGDPVLAVIHDRFNDADYSLGNLAPLRREMHDVLVRAGLYEKEATAMLATWERAYFESAGLRLFYVVPQEWINDRLPLSLSVPAEIRRVMVGRIELITQQQTELLDAIKRGPIASAEWLKSIPKSPARSKFFAGRSDFGDLGMPIPTDYQRYLDLGRFRNAML